MKFILLLLAILPSLAFAGQGSGNVSAVVSFGGAAMTSTVANGVSPYITLPPSLLSNVVTLQGGSGSLYAANFQGFYNSSSPSSQTQYQVPSGKTYYVLGVYWMSNASPGTLQLGYGTAALASEGTSTAPTGAIYYGSSSGSNNTGLQATSSSLGTYTYIPVPMSFPANSYPFWKGNGTNSNGYIVLIGYLQ